MKSYTELVKEIRLLKSEKRMHSYVELLGIITEIMAEHEIKPVVVGGLALEVYTRFGYFINDIDLALKNNSLLKSVLDKLGFVLQGKYLYSEELGAALDIHPLDADRINMEMLTLIKLQSGRQFYVIGMEDLILDRIRLYLENNSLYDLGWAMRVYKIYRGDIKMDYLLEKARENSDEAVYTIGKW